MRQLPSGTVTLLFTDVEGSTRLLQRLGPERYVRALTDHRRLLRETVAAHGGAEVEMQGDSFHFAFPSARAAVAAAAAGQRALAEHQWEAEPIRVRVGLHTGEPMQADGLYAGIDVHRAARVMSAGHGGQVLVSERTADLVRDELPDGVALRDLGEHRLKDLSRPQRLYDLIIDGVPSQFPPLKTLGRRPTNLPLVANRLIGRRRELAAITQRFRQRETRLLTLIGPGGTGKTRLALQAAAGLVDEFEDGVFFVPLASVRDADLVVPTIAQTLSLREQAGQTFAAALHDYLKAKDVLLLLDNFEHLLDAACDVSSLLVAAPKLNVLATSREPLRITGESAYAVPPLPSPARGDRISAAEALAHDAVTLFLERAKAARTDFELSDESASAIAAICARLDGLPLAVELAAARVRALSPQAIQKRLDASLKLLTGGARDADERQQTLRATIDWSYELLSDNERLLFASLSVFVGGCRLDAAESVCVPEQEPSVDILDTLTSLVNKSLLRQRDDRDGEPRYWMLETLREYGAEKLAETGSAEEFASRHATYFLALAEQAAPKLLGREQLASLESLENEHDNLRAALAWSDAAGQTETLVRLATALMRFWDYRGYLAEGIRWMERAHEQARVSELHARTHFGLGFLAYSRSDIASSIDHLERAAELFRAHGNSRALGQTLIELAWSEVVRGNEDRARSQAESGLALARDHDDRWYSASALQVLGAIAEPQRSVELCTEAAAIFRELGDETAAARSEGNAGWGELVAGRYERAREIFARSLAAAEAFGDAVQIGTHSGNLGLTELLDGDASAAATHLRAELESANRTGADRLTAEALWGLAGVFALRAQPGSAARLLGAAASLYDQMGCPPSSVDHQVEERFIRPLAAGDPEFAEAVAEGRALSQEEAIAYALDQLAAPSDAQLGAVRR